MEGCLGWRTRCEYLLSQYSSWASHSDGPEFTAPRFTIYCALGDHLKMTNRIMDALECFHQMNSELAGETSTHGEKAKWAIGECLRSHPCSVYAIDLHQTSSSIALNSWNTSETSQRRPNNTMKPLLNIQLHCPSIRSSNKTCSSSEARYIWQRDHGRRP